MPRDISIRPLQAGDRAAWARLWQAYLAFYETEVPRQIYDLTFARNLDPDVPAHQCFVAQQGGDLVGLVHIIYHPHTWRAEDVCYLQDLYTDQKVRSQGVGRALIEAVYAACISSD